MAAERVPVEVWQAILQDSIAVSTFFNPDPVDKCGLEAYARHYAHEDGYWRAERTRNRLRRVCGTWNAYLKPFNHRYIRLNDVLKGTGPFDAIFTAIRIRCDQFKFSFKDFMAKFLALDQESGEELLNWSLEILDGCYTEFTSSLIQTGRVPNLRCILSALDIYLQEMDRYTPNLYHLDSISEMQILPNRFKLSQLTSMAILGPSIHPLLVCELPSLRHLSIALDDDQVLHPNDMVILLRAFGKGLVTFFDNSKQSESFIPSEVWSFCPNLERFQSGLKWKSGYRIPSSLRYFRIPESLYVSYPYTVPTFLHFPIGILKRAGIGTVLFMDSWRRALEGYPAAIDCAMYAEDHGVVFQDILGVQFHEFIVMLLQNRKKVHAGFMGAWNCNYREF